MAPDGQAASAAPSELRTRIASAAVLAPIALAAMILGGVAFAALVSLVAAIAYWEWTGIAGALEPAWLRAGCLVCLAAGLFALTFSRTDWAIALVAVPALLTLVAGYNYRSCRWIGLGLVYVAVPCAGFIILRQAAPGGWAAILYLLIVVWATDIAAYFGGRSLGGPKLWPRLSPKKTWSGALSGLAAAIVAGGLVAWATGTGAVGTGLVLAAPLSIASQAGDLLESALKRRFGVKDSGRIIPGHGGVLDRMDGLFAAAALAWLIAGLGLGGDLIAPPGAIAAVSEAAS